MSSPHIDPASFQHKFVMTNGHRYHYVEEGDPNASPLLLVHGFPDHWYGWRHQIKYLASLGYRVIAVDCLGYGETDAPMELHKYGLKTICSHLVGIMDALSIPRVTLIGHDWGGAIVWRFGLHYPNRLHGIISICTSYGPPLDQYRSLKDIVKAVPEFEYQLAFADPNAATRMNPKIESFLRSTMGEVNQEDLDYMVQQYQITGLRGPLNYYKTTEINFNDEIGLHKNIDLPCWIILAEKDIYLKPRMALKMKDYMSQLKTTSIDAGHFVMLEKPDEINAKLKQCLEDLALRRSKASL